MTALFVSIRVHSWLILFAVALFALPGRAGAAPPAEPILKGVIGALPDIPLLVTGELQSRAKNGKLERRFNVEMLLDWQMDPPGARYTLRDRFGASLSHLALSWPGPGQAEYRFFTGLTNRFIHFFLCLCHNFLNSCRMDSSIYDQTLQCNSCHFSSDWIKSGKNNCLRSIINN